VGLGTTVFKKIIFEYSPKKKKIVFLSFRLSRLPAHATGRSDRVVLSRYVAAAHEFLAARIAPATGIPAAAAKPLVNLDMASTGPLPAASAATAARGRGGSAVGDAIAAAIAKHRVVEDGRVDLGALSAAIVEAYGSSGAGSGSVAAARDTEAVLTAASAHASSPALASAVLAALAARGAAPSDAQGAARWLADAWYTRRLAELCAGRAVSQPLAPPVHVMLERAAIAAAGSRTAANSNTGKHTLAIIVDSRVHVEHDLYAFTAGLGNAAAARWTVVAVHSSDLALSPRAAPAYRRCLRVDGSRIIDAPLPVAAVLGPRDAVVMLSMTAARHRELHAALSRAGCIVVNGAGDGCEDKRFLRAAATASASASASATASASASAAASASASADLITPAYASVAADADIGAAVRAVNSVMAASLAASSSSSSSSSSTDLQCRGLVVQPAAGTHARGVSYIGAGSSPQHAVTAAAAALRRIAARGQPAIVSAFRGNVGVHGRRVVVRANVCCGTVTSVTVCAARRRGDRIVALDAHKFRTVPWATLVAAIASGTVLSPDEGGDGVSDGKVANDNINQDDFGDGEEDHPEAAAGAGHSHRDLSAQLLAAVTRAAVAAAAAVAPQSAATVLGVDLVLEVAARGAGPYITPIVLEVNARPGLLVLGDDPATGRAAPPVNAAFWSALDALGVDTVPTSGSDAAAAAALALVPSGSLWKQVVRAVQASGGNDVHPRLASALWSRYSSPSDTEDRVRALREMFASDRCPSVEGRPGSVFLFFVLFLCCFVFVFFCFVFVLFLFLFSF
jgi:hypothetical protein